MILRMDDDVADVKMRRVSYDDHEDDPIVDGQLLNQPLKRDGLAVEADLMNLVENTGKEGM